jgi:GNAT superfamily N-acetyltransferase
MTFNLDSSFIQYSVEDDEVIIDLVKVETPRQGIGSKLVKMVIDLYNSEYSDKKLTLWAFPQDDTIDLDSLISFYENLGFVITDDSMKSCGVEMTY